MCAEWRSSAIVLSLVLAVGCDRPSPLIDALSSEAAVSTDPLVVTRGALSETLVLTGAVDAAVSVKLNVPRTDDWNISIRWFADEGTLIQPGDRVVEFDNAGVVDRIGELELAVVEAATELEGKQAENAVAVAEKAFEVRKHEIELAQADLDANVPVELVSRRDARDTELAVARAKSALAAARDDLKGAREGGRLEEQVARVAYDKAERALLNAEAQLEALEVRAPQEGIVIIGEHPWEGRKLQVGDAVWPGMTVARLPSLSEMIVEARLSDVDEGRITPGMRVSCRVDAFPEQPIAGFVRSLSPVAHQTVNQSPRRFFTVVIELDAQDVAQVDRALLRPGLSARVDVLARHADDALLVPRRAIDRSGERAWTRPVGGDPVEVEVEFCDAHHCAIRSGLAEGDHLESMEAGG